MGVRALPYRTSPEHVAATPWTSSDDGVPVSDHLPVWDYGTVVRLRRTVEVDMVALLGECGLGPHASLALNVRYWPGTSLIRRNVLRVALPAGEVPKTSRTVLDVEIPGTELAGSLIVETNLVLVDDASGGEQFVARRPGSTLWRDETTIRLEGAAGLLPVAPVSFKEQGLPEHAAWYVSIDSSEWGSAAMGNLLVLLNDDNPAVRRAVAAPDEPECTVLLDALTVDVVCDLVGRALLDDEFPTTVQIRTAGSEMSTAALVQSLITSFLSLPTETFEAAVKRLRDEWQRDPSRVRAGVQSNVRFPGSRNS